MTPRIERMGDWDSPSILIRVISVIRGRQTSVSSIRDFGKLGAVQLGSRSYIGIDGLEVRRTLGATD
jgi:hypothetical protein